MKSKEYRESFVASHVSSTIAAQIFMMREDREWTQTILAEKAGMKQSRISAIEDPDFENVEIATLRRLASAFDVGLSVRFVPFSEIAVQAGNLETSDLCVMNFDRDALPMCEKKLPIFASATFRTNLDTVSISSDTFGIAGKVGDIRASLIIAPGMDSKRGALCLNHI